MQNEIDFTKVTRQPIDADSKSDLGTQAVRFLRSFAWCADVLELYEGILEPDIVGVFLCKIRPARPEVDEWLWVIVGDLPPAYLVTDEAPNPACALDGYIALMRDWVKAAKRGDPVDRLIPVNAPPTPEYATMLDSRLRILSDFLAEEFVDDLKAGAGRARASDGRRDSLR